MAVDGNKISFVITEHILLWNFLKVGMGSLFGIIQRLKLSNPVFAGEFDENWVGENVQFLGTSFFSRFGSFGVDSDFFFQPTFLTEKYCQT